jgi:hypothetical protein
MRLFLRCRVSVCSCARPFLALGRPVAVFSRVAVRSLGPGDCGVANRGLRFVAVELDDNRALGSKIGPSISSVLRPFSVFVRGDVLFRRVFLLVGDYSLEISRSFLSISF